FDEGRGARNRSAGLHAGVDCHHPPLEKALPTLNAGRHDRPYQLRSGRVMHAFRLTGQSLLRAERNSNKCNWSTARKKIGPVNRPCDRPIDVISIASLMILATSRLADQRMKTNRAADEPGRCPAGLASGIVNKFGANPHAVTKLNSALRENSEKPPIGGDLSVLPFLGFPAAKSRLEGTN